MSPQQMDLLSSCGPLPEMPLPAQKAATRPKLPSEESQAGRLYRLLSDGLPHRTDEIVARIYGPSLSLARPAARIDDIKKKYGVRIDGWHDRDYPKLYWYHLIKTEAKHG